MLWPPLRFTVYNGRSSLALKLISHTQSLWNLVPQPSSGTHLALKLIFLIAVFFWFLVSLLWVYLIIQRILQYLSSPSCSELMLVITLTLTFALMKVCVHNKMQVLAET